MMNDKKWKVNRRQIDKLFEISATINEDDICYNPLM